jgi:hypothetical protein
MDGMNRKVVDEFFSLEFKKILGSSSTLIKLDFW